MVSHYWGQRLPKEWWWISANQFGSADVTIECSLLRSSIWGRKAQLPLGYFYYRNGSQTKTLISPPTRMRVSGSLDSFEVSVTPLFGRKLALKAMGREYADLGDLILNTLTGDLELWEGGKKVADAYGTATLERRQAEDLTSA